ncbi:MAG: lasso peptide biosynthesis protein [Thomasclavelia sp.]|nr:lasso peptide biosynthesis protein [Thomasclavelia sp.]
MKKLISVMISLMMCFSMVSGVYAVGEISNSNEVYENAEVKNQAEETQAEQNSENKAKVNEDMEVESAQDEDAFTLTYQGHVQNIGWQTSVNQGEIAGTTGKSKRLEAVKVNLVTSLNMAIEGKYRSDNTGWTNSENGQFGVTGKSKGLEAIRLNLTGDDASNYSIYYRVHVAGIGWLDWAKDGKSAGSDLYKSIEAIQIKILDKTQNAPGSTTKPFASVSSDETHIECSAHVQNDGWLKPVSQENIAGTTGKGYRLEAFRAQIVGNDNLSVNYESNIINSGWQSSVTDGVISGTTGKKNAISAIKMHLDGTDASNYSIYYRVHVAGIGWLDWAKDGQLAGNSMYYNIEAIQVKVLENTAAAPGATATPYKTLKDDGIHLEYAAHMQNEGWKKPVAQAESAGTTGKSRRLEAFKVQVVGNDNVKVNYQAHVQNVGWQSNKTDGLIAGTTGKSYRVEALKMSLTGSEASNYDIYYRCYVAYQGWLGWAKNGEEAGSIGVGLRVESIEATLIPKGEAAPGSTDNHLAATPHVNYSTYQSGSFGATVSDGTTSGVTGQSKAVNQFKASVASSTFSGGIQYSGHVQDVGWTSYTSGTVGQTNKRLEAIKINLTGALSGVYDVYYRVHAQNFGWLGWAKNGQAAGTKAYGYRIEAIEVKLYPKNAGSKPAVGNSFKEKVTSRRTIMLNNLRPIANPRDLYGCFAYVCQATTYVRSYNFPNYHDWDIDWVNRWLSSHTGHCYTYAAVFANLARIKGYNATIHCGYCSRRGGGLTEHSWVEINGLVYDPDMADSTGNYGRFYGKTRAQIGLGYTRDVVY